MCLANVTLALTLGIGLAGCADDPPAGLASDAPSIEKLVRGLGASEYDKREAATAELEKRGLAALPALREAAKSSDLEVSERAAELVRKISAANPQTAFSSQVNLDYEQATLEEVVKGIASQTGVKIELMGNSGKPVSLREAKPLPFWSAIDRVCAAGGLIVAPSAIDANAFIARQRLGGLFDQENADEQAALALTPGKPVAYPSFYSDFHCVRLFRIQEALNGSANLSFGDDADAVNQSQETRSRSLDLMVLTKPGAKSSRSLVELSAIKIIDDQDRNIVNDPAANLPPGANAEQIMRNRALGARNAQLMMLNSRTASPSALMCRVQLLNPEPPAKTIKLAQGTVRLTWFQETKATTIELEKSLGKTIETPESKVQIEEIKVEGNQIIKIKAKITSKAQGDNDFVMPNARFGGAMPFGDMGMSMGIGGNDQIQFLDAKGQSLRPFTSSSRGNGRTLDSEWQFREGPQGPPKTLVIRGSNRQETNISFEFRDIPMPKVKS